ncbi:MAG: Gfo/Idh/MocA family oxidoreductase [Clostridia bacterium]|nr:Gfo/Idh/MocA family oxidoreductase [Clostridia bacterium]
MAGKKTKPLRAVLIGAGHISLEYQKGLAESEKIKLLAIVDIDKTAIGFKYFPNTQKFSTIEDLPQNDFDVAIISTPPSTHYNLIKTCLERNWNVIVEKPFALSLDLITDAYVTAKKTGLFLATSYHWQNGEEVRAFNKLYNPRLISKIDVSIEDPYSLNGVSINGEKIPLEGAWIDSGVNALSMVKTWLPFSKTKILNVDTVFADNIHLPIYCKADMEIDGIPVSIKIDWRNQKNIKLTRLTYLDREIIINHSEQTVFDGESALIFNSLSRLTRHYFNYYTGFKCRSNFAETIAIHKLLLKVRDTYDKKIVY